MHEICARWERERYRERERERERERDGSDVTIVALKLAMSLHSPMPKILTIGDKLTLLLPNIRTFCFSLHTSRLFLLKWSSLWRWNSQWVHTFRCQKFLPSPKQTIEFPSAPSFFLWKKWIKLLPKTIGNRKKRLCLRLRSEDKHHLRKYADQKAQIRKAFVSLTRLIFAFRSADFLRWCLSSDHNLKHNLFFCISNSFWC